MRAETVRCPDCGHDVPVPPGARPGDVIECPQCAGLALRVSAEGDGWVATIAHRVSCPDCDRVITLPEGARPGDPIECGARRYRLKFEYGAFAAEPDPDVGGDRRGEAGEVIERVTATLGPRAPQVEPRTLAPPTFDHDVSSRCAS